MTTTTRPAPATDRPLWRSGRVARRARWLGAHPGTGAARAPGGTVARRRGAGSGRVRGVPGADATQARPRSISSRAAARPLGPRPTHRRDRTGGAGRCRRSGRVRLGVAMAAGRRGGRATGRRRGVVRRPQPWPSARARELCGAARSPRWPRRSSSPTDTGADLAAGLWLVLAARAAGAIPFVRVQILRLRRGSGPVHQSDLAQAAALAITLVRGGDRSPAAGRCRRRGGARRAADRVGAPATGRRSGSGCARWCSLQRSCS